MKKLLIALALVCGSAHAETWFEMPNKAGGKVILTMGKCSGDRDGRIVIATAPDGSNSMGCWYYFADMVHIVWNDGSIKTSSFDPNNFVQKSDGK